MVSSMKTTIDITDGLLAEAKRIAASEHTTVRALVEEGLQQVLAERRERPPFKLRDGSYRRQAGHPTGVRRRLGRGPGRDLQDRGA